MKKSINLICPVHIAVQNPNLLHVRCHAFSHILQMLESVQPRYLSGQWFCCKSVLLHQKTYTREIEYAAKLIVSKKPDLLRGRRRLHLQLDQAILRLDRKTPVVPHDPLARDCPRRDDVLVTVGVRPQVDFRNHFGRALHRNKALIVTAH